MPEAVKQAGSLISLSVIATGLVTSISLTVLYFFGDGVMQARETRIEMPYVIKSLDHLVAEQAKSNIKLEVMLEQANRNRLEIAKHTIEMSYCKERLNNCEESHRVYHHEAAGTENNNLGGPQ